MAISYDKNRSNSRSQSNKFKEFTREPEVDEDEKRWNERFNMAAKAKPNEPERN